MKYDFYLEDGKYRNCYLGISASEDQLPTTNEEAFDGRVFYEGYRDGSDFHVLTKYLGDNPQNIEAKEAHADTRNLQIYGVELPQAIPDWKNFTLKSVLLELFKEATSITIEVGGKSMKVTLEIPEPAVAYAKSIDLNNYGSPNADSETKAYQKLMVERFETLRSMNLLRKVELWLDPDKGYALTRRLDSTPDGRQIESLECENFEFTGRGKLWLPRKSTMRFFLSMVEILDVVKKDPDFVQILTLQKFSFDRRKDVSFVISHGPETDVSDYSTVDGEARHYTIPGGKDTRDVAVPPMLPAQAQAGLSKVVIINIAVLVVVVGFVLWRWLAGR